MRRYILFLLLLFPLTLTGQQRIVLEALPPHSTTGGQGVASAFYGKSNDYLLIAGGTNYPDTAMAQGGKEHFYNTIWDLGKRGWHKKRFNLPTPTAYGASVQLSDEEGFLCIGGSNGRQSLKEVYRLTDKELEQLPSLPIGIDRGAAASDGKDVYVVGGQSNGQPQMEVYRISLSTLHTPYSTQKWESITALPGQARLQPCAVVQTNGQGLSLYVFGGYDPTTNKIANNTLELNLKTLEWQSFPDCQATTDMSAVASGYSHVLFFGGANQTVYNPDILVYHTITHSWFSIPGKSLLARTGSGLIDLGDNSYVLLDGENKPGVRSSEILKVTFEHETHFGRLNWLVLAGYLLLMLALGFYFLHRDKGSDDYFRAGGRIPWWAAGISIYATMLSALTYMAIPAKAYATNWTYYPMIATMLLVAYPVVRYYLPHFRKLNLTSAYEYLEVRFNLATRLTASGLFIIFMIARMALVLYLPSLALSAVTGIDLRTCILLMGLVTIVYSTVGGVEAVIWGDVIQGFILVGGAVFAAAYLILHTEGGAEGFWQIATSDNKMRLFEWSLDYRHVTFWVAIVGGIANNLISYTSDQTVIQRYLTTKDTASAKRSVWMNSLLFAVINLVFYTIGTGLYTFFKTHPERLDLTMNQGDAILPFFMMSQLPQGIAGLLVAAIFAATMSTLSSNINSISTAFSIDFWKRFRTKVNDREMLRVARLASVAGGIVGILLALSMATWDILSLLDYFNIILGLLSSGLGGLFLMGIFLPRINGRSALAGFCCGTITVFWLHYHTDTSFMLFGAIGMAVSVLVGWFCSLRNNTTKHDLHRR
ncbi:MAG: sodium/solute symporter [Bacteroidaceae bacterium]|nr:sodium/solute symporter [Bacteroidaceae bacterium]